MYRAKAFWTQIKTAAATLYANRHYLERLRATNPALLASAADNGFHVVGDVRVDSTAEVHPSAKIGPNVTIGPGVVVGPGARVKDAIVLENVILGVRSVVLCSVLCAVSSV